MNLRPSTTKRIGLLARWILANLAGWAAGLGLGDALVLPLSNLFGLNEDPAMVYIVLVSLGLAVGVAQALVLGPILPRSLRRAWAPATLGGYLLALLVIRLFQWTGFGWAGVFFTNLLLFVLMGAAIGIPQALLLRRSSRAAGLWIPAASLTFLGFLWFVQRPAGSTVELVAPGVLLGAAASIATGLVVVKAEGGRMKAEG